MWQAKDGGRDADIKSPFTGMWQAKDGEQRYRYIVTLYRHVMWQAKDANLKVVLKPDSEEGLWKVILEPRRGDLRFLSRKISVLGLLNIQVT